MVLLQILNGKKAGANLATRHFPVHIGRAANADLPLEDPGIWDDHLQIRLRPDRSFEAVVSGSAIATLNAEPLSQAVLHNGDVLGLGSVQIRFGLSPTRQRSLRFREAATWFALALLCFAQVALIYLLG